MVLAAWAFVASRAIYYDTETTGIRPASDEIIELAAYDPDRDRTFDELINPGCPIPAEATAVHKITDEMVAEKPSFAEVGQRFIEWCDGDVILVAHNNDKFDLPFLKASFERHGLDMPQWRFFDTLKWSRRYRPDLPRHALQVLREVYGVEANNAHRALDDVKVLYDVFSQMVDDLPIEKALELLYEKRDTHRMPFGKHRGKPLDQVPADYLRWLASSGALDKPDNVELREKVEAMEVLA